MKVKFKKVTKFEYEGELYDSEDDILRKYNADVINKIFITIKDTIDKSKDSEISSIEVMEFVANISNDELRILRKYINKDT